MLTRSFKKILEDLKPIEDIKEIVLSRDNQEVGRIPNEEGKRGSLAVYAHLVGHKEGEITAREAIYGLELFAEHTPDAQKHPGKHPNIDRLLDIIDKGYGLKVEVVYVESR